MNSVLGASGRVGSTVDRLIATIDSESSDTSAHEASSSLPFVNELSASTENRARLFATDSARQDHAAQHTRRRANHFLVGHGARPSWRYQLAHPSQSTPYNIRKAFARRTVCPRDFCPQAGEGAARFGMGDVRRTEIAVDHGQPASLARHIRKRLREGLDGLFGGVVQRFAQQFGL